MKLKKYFYISALSLACVFTSCDAILNLSPEDYYGSGNFWTNASQVEGAMYGIHNQMRGSYDFLIKYGEARGGTMNQLTSALGTTQNWASPIKDNDFREDKAGVDDWGDFYSKILNLNVFIQKVSEECSFLSESERKQYLAQAHGIRAFYYFWMYRTWGGLPLIKTATVLDGKITSEGLYTKQSSPKTIMGFIKEEVNESERLFGDKYLEVGKDDHCFWSLAATKMLKAEVYLWSAKVTTGDQTPDNKDITTAKEALTPLIDRFKMLNDFGKLFNTKGKDNTESIFTLRFNEGEATNFFANFIPAPNVFIGQVYDRDGDLIETDTLQQNGTGLERHSYKWELWSKYDADDQRRDKTFFDYYYKDGKFRGAACIKNMGHINSSNVRIYDGDIHIYRYADVLLTMAEIENYLGNPVAPWINEVRERAYGDKFAGHEYTDSDFTTNEKAILLERDKEFVTEGKRWFDLVRMKDAKDGKSLAFDASVNYRENPNQDLVPVLNYDTESHKLLWPISKNTRISDPELDQNPGY